MWQLLRVDYLGTTSPRVLYRRVNAKKARDHICPLLPSPPLLFFLTVAHPAVKVKDGSPR